MPRHVATFVGLSSLLVCWTSTASAQDVERSASVVQETAARGGRVHGVVCDEAGRALAGVSVLAVGGAALPLSARSDATGQFTLALPPGAYVLRAAREGYVSTYREPVEIQPRTQLERNIVLTRTGASHATRVILAGAGAVPEDADEGAPLDEAPEDEGADHPHSEAAWRLRHLTPTALRDIADVSRPETAGDGTFKPRLSFADWVMGESARAAASFFTNTDFTGQVNFLTTSSLAAAADNWLPAELPHGIAYIAVGAPVGSAGDWSVRGALSARALASWVVLGEYAARTDQPHAFRAGVSYSSQPTAAGSEIAPAAVSDRMRSVGGVYGFDRWQVRPGVALDYGLRLDRYDYVSDAQFVSPRLGVRLRLLPETHLTMAASNRVLAPGANEFLPPPSGGPWLPPERTFAPLVPGSAFRAEHVRDLQIGIEQQLSSSGDGPVLAVRRFQQSVRDQVATLFGLDAERGVGHYYVATPGNVTADGWIFGLSVQFLPRVKGVVEYTTAESQWISDAEAAAIAAVVPTVVRAGRERLHDVTTSINAAIPETSTKFVVAYRISTALGGALNVLAPRVGRFNMEVRQALPVRLPRSSRTELVIVLRNLSREAGERGSLYDELLTVSPPMRVMGGVQVRF